MTVMVVNWPNVVVHVYVRVSNRYIPLDILEESFGYGFNDPKK